MTPQKQWGIFEPFATRRQRYAHGWDRIWGCDVIEYGTALRDRFARAMQAGHCMPLRTCSICDYPLHYFIADGQLYFQSACECSAYHSQAPAKPCDISDLDLYSREDNGISRQLAAWAASKGF